MKPNGWAQDSLSQLCVFRNGINYTKASKGDQVRVVGVKDFQSNYWVPNDNLDEVRLDGDLQPLDILAENDLLFVRSNGNRALIGRCMLAGDVNEPIVHSGFTIRARLISGAVVPAFLCHFLRTEEVRRTMIDGGIGTNIKSLSQSTLGSILVPVPTLTEQRRIVGILDEAFAGIATAKANTEQNLRNAREVFESELHATFTHCTEAWTEDRLEVLAEQTCSLSYGIVQPGEEWPGGLPIVRPSDLSQKFIRLEGLKRVNPAVAKAYSRTTLVGDELLLCVRGSTGVVSVASKELTGANVTRGIVPIRFQASSIQQAFGYYLFRSSVVQDQIRAGTYGAALVQINIRDLRRLKLAFPSLQEQEAVVRRLDRLTVETQCLESLYRQKLAALDALKKSLLHQAFTGQLTAEDGGRDARGD